MKTECYECTGELKEEETGMRCLKCGGLYVKRTN